MNVELTIQKLFDTYPEEYKDRSDALNQLFCVIGNGYKWHKGELVEKNFTPSPEEIAILESHLVNGKAHQHNCMSVKQTMFSYMKEIDKMFGGKSKKGAMSDSEISNMLSFISDDAIHDKPRERRWYFYLNDYSDYSYIFNYPDNIKQDWLDAINETKAMLKEDGYDLVTPIDTDANWLKARNSAHRSLKTGLIED